MDEHSALVVAQNIQVFVGRAEDIDIMTGNAQKDACGLTNPRCPKDVDVKAIYTAAL